MIISKTWYIILTVALLVGNVATAALTEELSPPTIAPGERTTLTIRLDYSDLQGVNWEDDGAVPELFDEPLQKADGLILLDRSYERTTSHFVWRYVFTAYLPTKYRIPAVEIRYGAQTFSTTSQNLIVQSYRAENDEELRPEFEAVSAPVQMQWKWFAVAAALLLAAALGFYLRKRATTKPQGTANTFLSPEDWLKQALQQFLQTHSSKNKNEPPSHKPTQAVEDYTTLLREYLRRRYLMTTPTMTLRELQQWVRAWDGVHVEKIESLQALLNKAERVLFWASPVDPEFPEKAATLTGHVWIKDAESPR